MRAGLRFCLRAGKHARFAVGADDDDRHAGLGHAPHLRGRARYVENGERNVVVDIIRKPGPKTGFEQDRFAAYPNTARFHVDVRHRLQIQRRERQRDERRDAVAGAHTGFVAQTLANLEHAPDEHAAAAGDGVVLFAALANDVRDMHRDTLGVAVAAIANLFEGCGVDVQRFHVAENLVVERDGRVVDLARVLRHRPRRIDDAMRAERIGAAIGSHGH